MNPVIPCSTTDTLQWFLARTRTSIVLSTAFPIESVFPPDVRQALANETHVPDLGVASPAVLREVIGRDVKYNELLIFSGSSLIGSVSEQPKNSNEVIVELIRVFDQNYQTAKRSCRINRVLRLLRIAQAERPMSPKGHITPTSNRDPHEVLGLSHGASLDEIRATRNKLIKQYHPDKVAQLGEKIREVAEAETKEINAAYDEVKRRVTEAKVPFSRTRRRRCNR